MRDSGRGRSFAAMPLTATDQHRTASPARPAGASSFARAARRTLAFSIIAAGLGGAALTLQLTERDVSERIFFTHSASYGDAIDAKGTRAECPRASMLIGGGAAIQHGHDTPSIALFQGLPIDGGWEVQAQETDPEDDLRRPWTLESIAVCLRD
jgi:hypothetical protein